MQKVYNFPCNKKRCSGCLQIKLTVNRFLFDGMCADCTDKALEDIKFAKDAKALNKLFIGIS